MYKGVEGFGVRLWYFVEEVLNLSLVSKGYSVGFSGLFAFEKDSVGTCPFLLSFGK